MIKTLIFDFDGTIANTIPFTFKKILEINKKFNVFGKNEKKIIEKIRTMDYKDLIKNFKISWMKIPLIVWEIKKSQEELYFQIEKIKVFSGIKNLLKNLNKKNISCYIYSSNTKKNIEKFLEVNNLKKYFKKIYTGSNLLGKDKDLIKILKKEKLKKEETLYVADEIRDFIACKKIDLKMIGVLWGMARKRGLTKKKIDYLVKKPKQILEIVLAYKEFKSN